MTGRRPDSHRLTRKRASLYDAELTLAELLADHGYTTHGAVANPNGSSFFGLDQGFHTYVELFWPPGDEVRRAPGAPDRTTLDARGARRSGAEFHAPHAEEALALFRSWLAGLGEDETPFYYLHLLEPHEPYTPPEPFLWTFVDPDYDGPLRDAEVREQSGNRAKDDFDEEDRAAFEALYDANVLYADDVLGRMFDLLRGRGLYDDFLIVVTSDHGEAFWQHGAHGHNTQLHDEMVRVPIVVKPPGTAGERGVIEGRLVSILDVYPGICDWIGLRPPDHLLDGTSLARHGAGADRRLYLRTHAKRPSVASRSIDRKTIVLRDEEGGVTGIECYDLAADPGEQHPLTEGCVDSAEVEELAAFARPDRRRERGRGGLGRRAPARGLGAPAPARLRGMSAAQFR